MAVPSTGAKGCIPNAFARLPLHFSTQSTAHLIVDELTVTIDR